MQDIKISKRAAKRLKSGYLWVFSNELAEVPKYEPGSLVSVKDAENRNYGLGFYNPNSLISVRILNTEKEIDSDFFEGRIRKALDYRKRILPSAEMYRLVFG